MRESWAPYTYDYFYRAAQQAPQRAASRRDSLPTTQMSAGDVAWLAGVYALDIDEQLDESRVGVYHRSGLSGILRQHRRSRWRAATTRATSLRSASWTAG